MPLSGTGSTTVGFVNSGGMSVGQNYILSFYINTVDDNPSGTILVRILWQGATDNLNFDGRNIPAVYVVDGVPTDYGFTTDSDSSTWQHVTIDLTQTRYPGWPYVPTTWDPATQPLTHITINPGSNNVIVDNVSLIAVPEPGTLAAASILSGAALLRRRRR